MKRLAPMVAAWSLLFACAPSASAAPAAPIAQQGRAALTVAPVSVEATVEPGEQKRGYVDVFNVGEVAVTVRPEVEGVRVGDDGAFEIRRDPVDRRVESFIEIDRTAFRLRPGVARRVGYAVTVPKDAWTGGYFGMILFRIMPPVGGSGLAIRQSGRVGTVLVLRTAGPADRGGSIVELEERGAPWSRQHEFTARFRNTGRSDRSPLGIAYRPRGHVEVTDMFGRSVHRDDVRGRLLLPGESTRIEAGRDNWFWLGRYTATMRISAERGAPARVESVTFWAVSWPAGIALLVVLLLAAASIGVTRHRRHQP